MTREVGQNGLDLIEHCEGTRLTVYLDSRGLQTVGTGHLVLPADNLALGERIDPETAEAFLEADLAKAAACVDRNCPDLTSNQRDACVSLCFNIGCGAFGNSTLVKLIHAGDLDGAADEFQVWTRAGNAHPRGLKIRRALEADLFRTPDDVPMDPLWLSAHDDED